MILRNLKDGTVITKPMVVPESNVTSTIDTYEKHRVTPEIKTKTKFRCAFCGYEEDLAEKDLNELLSFGGPVCPDCLKYKGKRVVKLEKIS